MAKKQKKSTGLIVATSVLAALFTLSAVIIGLFVGFNTDTVLAAIKNKETSFALSSDVEAVQAEKEQAILDAEAEKAEAVETVKKQILIDRHVLGIDNVEDLVGVELNDSTWSTVSTKSNYRPIENNWYYSTIYYMITEENKETFINYLKSLNLDADDKDDKYVMMRTESGFEIYTQFIEGTSNTGICIGDDRAIPFGYDRNNDSLICGTFSNSQNKIYSVEMTRALVEINQDRYGLKVRTGVDFQVFGKNRMTGKSLTVDDREVFPEENERFILNSKDKHRVLVHTKSVADPKKKKRDK